ncbi:hypothetical protein ACFQFQ_12695 [Sulfitobacter porphyrae]|uniref:Uncharacterized protein n=1 Tax=Sulfitobacter porphyrae TaxID=1246864 RepID=A0ABW2B3M8_9RHOB
MAAKSKTRKHVAECHGVKVPDSPMMTPERAERINAARYEGQEIAARLRSSAPATGFWKWVRASGWSARLPQGTASRKRFCPLRQMPG